MKTRLVPIPANSLAEAWPQIAPFIAAIAEGSSGKYMSADLVKAVSARDMQLWATITADNEMLGVATSEVVQFPRKKVSRLIGATGTDSNLWLEHMTEIEDWARQLGCTANEPIARPGWEKVLMPLGYKKTHVMLEKQL